MNIHSILDFIALTNEFRAVERLIYVPNGDTNREINENDAEHSYQLTMLAWYLLSNEDYGLNIDLVIKYALIHDFVEVYAGDTDFYRSDKESNNKKKREKEAAFRLKKEIPGFQDLHASIEDYEDQIDREARFVYALDKLVPILNIYLGGGKLWKDKEVTLERLLEAKIPKIAISPEVESYFKEMVAILEDNKHMFHM